MSVEIGNWSRKVSHRKSGKEIFDKAVFCLFKELIFRICEQY